MCYFSFVVWGGGRGCGITADLLHQGLGGGLAGGCRVALLESVELALQPFGLGVELGLPNDVLGAGDVADELALLLGDLLVELVDLLASRRNVLVGDICHGLPLYSSTVSVSTHKSVTDR
jgi:hypothetical protein